jgi:hypothetical protein
MHWVKISSKLNKRTELTKGEFVRYFDQVLKRFESEGQMALYESTDPSDDYFYLKMSESINSIVQVIFSSYNIVPCPEPFMNKVRLIRGNINE